VPELTGAAPGSAAAAADEDVLFVDVPPTRADVLHECDVVEDVAIAYGYNRLARRIPPSPCPGAQQPLNKLTEALRAELAACGYYEALTFALVSREENFAALRLADDGAAVELANPKTEDFQVGRTRLLPGLLKSLAANRARVSFADGAKLFEISDVILRDAAQPVGARNERRLAALYSGTAAGFEVVHGLADRVMQLLEVPVKPYSWAAAAQAKPAGAAAPAAFGRAGTRYTLEHEPALPMYFAGRAARVVLETADGARAAIGTLGVLHPDVLKNFGLDHPCSVLEICIESFA
jgi:phenylalanyl-tRNA synthetase beta chain